MGEMIEFLKNNYGTIIVVVVLLILVIIAIISIKKSKGKCAYCRHADTCPFNKKKSD